MPIALMLLAAQAPHAVPDRAPPQRVCSASHLRLSLDAKGGDYNGMSHAGTELSIRNAGPDCMLPALPLVELRDRRGRVLPAVRRAPPGMHPGPVMVPLRLSAGHRVAADLRWVSGPVFTRNRSIRPARITVRVGNQRIATPIRATLYGETGKPVAFDQTPLRMMEGMPAG